MGLEVYVGIRRRFLFKIPYIWVFYVHHRYSAVVFSFNTFIITLDAKDWSKTTTRRAVWCANKEFQLGDKENVEFFHLVGICEFWINARRT